MRISRLFQIFTAVIFISGCSKNEIKESSGLKIIALSPGIVETVFFLGKGDNIIGASGFCDYPPEAKNIPVVANVSDINMEFTLKLAPDIVLVMPSQQNIADKLNLMNIKTVIVHQETLDQILNSFLVIGKEIKRGERSLFVHDSLKSVLNNYKNPSNGLKILLSVGREYGSGITYIYSNGKTGFLNDIITLLGYINALETAVPYPKIGVETILTLDPDFIIDLVPSDININENNLLNDWKLFENSKAYKKGKILIFKGDQTTIPGPRIFDFIKDLKEKGL